jgi:serine protease Do
MVLPLLALPSGLPGQIPSVDTAQPLSGKFVPRRDWSLRQTPVVDAVRRVRDAVVNIHSERTARGPGLADELFAFAPTQNRVNGMGTGIIIDPRGYIITNQHVVDDVQSIRVHLADGSTLAARVLARDLESDLALIKVDPTKPLPVMPLATATDLMVGETVIAIGNAYGYEHTVSVGVVSATGRNVNLNKEVSYRQLIQTDASINPGNSGGPLVNIYGDLVGVNVAIRAGAQGIGFAIPVETMIRVASSMLANKVRGGLSHGLSIRDEVQVDPTTGSCTRRAFVDRTDAGAPAGKAGLLKGDLLVKVGNLPIQTSLDVERALLDLPAGQKIPVVYRRGEVEAATDLVLEAVRPLAPAGDLVWRRLGVKLNNVQAELVSRAHPQLHGGLLIDDVRTESAAARAGVRPGDILVGLHQWEMVSADNVIFVLNHPDLGSFNPMRFYVLRAGQVLRGSLLLPD